MSLNAVNAAVWSALAAAEQWADTNTYLHPAVDFLNQQPWYYSFCLGALISVIVLSVLDALCSPRSKRGYGSGENNRWNRRIRTERPKFVSKHYKLQHVWKYVGAGTSVDMDVVKKGIDGAVSAIDSSFGYPLSGHLIGRHVWQPVTASNSSFALPEVLTSEFMRTQDAYSNLPARSKEAAALKAAKSAQDSLLFDPSVNVNSGDKILRAQLLQQHGGDSSDANPPPPRGAPSVSAEEALDIGWDFFEKLLTDDGHYAGDYGGPLFLLPGLVLTSYISRVDLGERRGAILTYLLNHQQADGGWGLHTEGPSTMFGTCLNYVAARLLGMPADDEVCVAARRFIHTHGGAVMNPHWGKFWLAALGVYEWEGVNPIPPELWMLPNWFPFHPGKMWCHCRMVYLPMSYVYGGRFTAPIGEIQQQLRQELYTQDYNTINWDSCRNTCATIDLYAPHTLLMDIGFYLISRYERYAPSFIRKPLLDAGMKFAFEYIEAEDLQTNYVDIGPVNKVINMLAVFFARGKDSDQFNRHVARIDDYLWVAEDGMKMQGYNGSQSWDTSFAMQALAAAGPEQNTKHNALISRIMSYLDATQIKNDVPMRERYFRTISKGGWPFSTNDHGWPIADCTSEGMKATLAIRSLAMAGIVDIGSGFADGFGGLNTGSIAPNRYYDAVEVLLAFHNPDGGWATYEEMRGGPWYEFLNPAEVFGDIMIDYTYTELTSACVTGLVAFQRHFPSHKPVEVANMIAKGVQYVREQQREDGSWYGSWAVCFTYGCWFGVEALMSGGDPLGKDARALEKCCSFLLSKQRGDGGWGETYLSCLTKQYSQGESTVVNTAWALLALIHAQCPDRFSIRRGIDFLISKQTANGDWAQENVSGIFNRTCGITYTAYRNVFPLWALAAFTNGYKYKVASITQAPTKSSSSDEEDIVPVKSARRRRPSQAK